MQHLKEQSGDAPIIMAATSPCTRRMMEPGVNSALSELTTGVSPRS